MPGLILLQCPGPFTGAVPAVLTAAALPPLPKSAVPPLLILYKFLVEDMVLVATAPPVPGLCPLCPNDVVGAAVVPPTLVLSPCLGGGGGLSPFFFGMVR
jgi:hypothetical protein